MEHRARLEAFKKPLDSASFPAVLAPAEDDRPYDVLIVWVENESADPTGWQLELSFVPGMEAELEGVSLLQLFVKLPVEVAEPALPELQHAIVAFNRTLPLIGFGYVADPPMVCFRNVLLLPEDEQTAIGLVVQASWMVSYLLSLFSEPMVEIAAGRATLREAVEGRPYAGLFV